MCAQQCITLRTTINTHNITLVESERESFILSLSSAVYINLYRPCHEFLFESLFSFPFNFTMYLYDNKLLTYFSVLLPCQFTVFASSLSRVPVVDAVEWFVPLFLCIST